MEAMADTVVDTMLATVEVIITMGNDVSLINVIFQKNVKTFWSKLSNKFTILSVICC